VTAVLAVVVHDETRVSLCEPRGIKDDPPVRANVDRGIANLVEDLHDRGMQDDVMVVVWGEYRAMGIDPAQTFPNGSGRPMYVLDDRNLVTELV